MFLMLVSVSLSGQTKTGTLKVFSEISGISVFMDEVKQDNYQEIKNIPVGTHYVKVLNSSGAKVYGSIVTINESSVTTVLIESSQNVAAQPVNAIQQPAEQKPAGVSQGTATGKGGTLNIFSELTGISVYLDENKQGDDIKQIQGVPAGSHYLKVMKDGVGIFGELVIVSEGQTTSVLVKNDGQVAEKIMESKVKERQEYQGNKIDILFSSNSLSKTSGSSTLFPGYYGYWGYSSSATTTTQIADFKIIKGGVEEIFDTKLATLVNNQKILDAYNADYRSWENAQKGALITSLAAFVPFAVFTIDICIKKPFLHDAPTDPNASSFSTVPAWEWTGYILSGLITWVGIKLSDAPSSRFIKPHYYKVDEAAKDAQAHNKKLKEKLGLPESYDIDKK